MRQLSCLSLAVLCVVGCADNAKRTPSSSANPSASISTSVAPSNESQSFGDFSFSVPSGWSIVTPDRGKTKAMLLLDGTNWQNAKAMIKIDVGKPVAPTPKQLAENFANSTGGSVTSDTLDFDGTLGISASTSSDARTTPRNMIVIHRNGKAYLLMAGATSGVDITAAVSQVRESWKWTHTNVE